jgi:hypothetical protein
MRKANGPGRSLPSGRPKAGPVGPAGMTGSACPPQQTMRAEVRDPVGTARTKVGLARLWHIQSLSKSATADFDERAVSYPTSTPQPAHPAHPRYARG